MVTMFLARVVPAASLASSMNGTGTHLTSSTGPRSIWSRGVSSVASYRTTAFSPQTISPRKRPKSAQLKTTSTCTRSPWAKIGSALNRTVHDDSPPRICGP